VISWLFYLRFQIGQLSRYGEALSSTRAEAESALNERESVCYTAASSVEEVRLAAGDAAAATEARLAGLADDLHDARVEAAAAAARAEDAEHARNAIGEEHARVRSELDNLNASAASHRREADGEITTLRSDLARLNASLVETKAEKSQVAAVGRAKEEAAVQAAAAATARLQSAETARDVAAEQVSTLQADLSRIIAALAETQAKAEGAGELGGAIQVKNAERLVW
jgi:chromosome segregation ATPase